MYILYLDVNSISKASSSSSVPSYGGTQSNEDGNEFYKDCVEYSQKDLYAIQDIGSQPNLFRLIVNSLCPSIYGHELVKGKYHKT